MRRAEIVCALSVMHITPRSKLPKKNEERFGIEEKGVARLGRGIMNGIRRIDNSMKGGPGKTWKM